jgi:hypothetical protein
MIRPLLVGNQIYFDNPQEKEITDVIAAAIDSNINSPDYYPHCITATLQELIDEAHYHSDSSGTTLISNKRTTLGVFLTPDDEYGNYLVNIEGACQYSRASSLVNIYPVLGRVSATSLTQNDAAAANQSSFARVIPCTTNPSGTGVGIVSFNETIIIEQDDNSYPLFLAWVFENLDSDKAMNFNANLSMRKYIDQKQVYMPVFS